MPEDPRRAIIEVMARLGKETQYHIDERQRHFQITDLFIVVVSFMLVVLAIFNIYYVRVLYKDMTGIVVTMESMYGHLMKVDQNVSVISDNVEKFDNHMQHMTAINTNIDSLSKSMPKVRADMDIMRDDMLGFSHDMGLLGNAMGSIDQRMFEMKGGMAVMRNNMRQIANPMGAFNPMMP
jgi:hypothetical protein